MKNKWAATDLSDIAAQVRIYGSGSIDIFVIEGLPREHRKRATLINQAVQERLFRREHKQLVAKISILNSKITIKQSRAGEPLAPPVIAEMLLSFLAPKNTAQAFLGDLQEMFERNAERFGEKQARRKYWMEVGRSLAPLVWQWLKRLGFLTLLVNFFRSKSRL